MRQRLEQFLAAENISQTQFAESINVARAGISHILSGRNKPSYEFIVNTMEAYPMLDIEWLLTGKGKMFKDDEAAASSSSSDGLLFSGAQIEKQTPATAPTTIQPPVAKLQPPAVKPQPQPQILPPVEKPQPQPQPQLQNQVEKPLPQSPTGKPQPQTRRISRIVALYEDNTFEEFISWK